MAGPISDRQARFVGALAGVGFFLLAIKLVMPYLASHHFPFVAIPVLAVAAGLSKVVSNRLSRPRSDVLVRGRALISFEEAVKKGSASLKRGDPYIPLGGVPLPYAEASRHILLLGAQGTGKSLTIQLILRQVLPLIGRGYGCRMVLTDHKQEMVSLLREMGVDEARIRVMNPFDSRCWAWDMARDITTREDARFIAKLLIPSSGSKDPYWANAAAQIIQGILLSFRATAGDNWTLRDVVCAIENEERISVVLRNCSGTAGIADKVINDTQAWQNILQHIAEGMDAFVPIAAAWKLAYDQGRRLSLNEWVKTEESVLVFGTDTLDDGALSSINRVLLLKLSSDLIKSGQDVPESSLGKTWFVLDEFKAAGRFDNFERYLVAGRSKGVCYVLGYQDVEGLRAVYGDHVANEISGNCGAKAFYHTDSAETAHAMSEAFGEVELVIRNRSVDASGRASVSEARTTNSVVLDSEFLALKTFSQENGLQGYFVTQNFGPWRGVTDYNAIVSELVPRKKVKVTKEPWLEDITFVPEWTREDCRRLKLSENVLQKRGKLPPRFKRLENDDSRDAASA